MSTPTCSRSDCRRPASVVVRGLSQSGRTWATHASQEHREHAEMTMERVGFSAVTEQPAGAS